MSKRILIVNYREDGEPGVEVTSVVITPPSVAKTKYETIAEGAETHGLGGEWLLAVLEANGGAAAIEITVSAA